jgi:hypothetical protein
MSTINPGNNLQFKSTDSLFARVRKKLNSFDNAGILDEGDWYKYIKDVIVDLGCAVYEEHEAIVMVKDFKGPLPDDFSYLYAAYKCTPDIANTDSKNTLFPQTGFVFYIDETHEPYKQCKNCYAAKREFVDGEKITIRTYIQGQPLLLNFSNRQLLQLSGNVKGLCDEKCKNLFYRCNYEITLDKSTLYANFNNDSVYMKYYGLALDRESGLPMIPDHSYIENAIEDYIVYRIFEDFWFNGSVPDIENRYRVAKSNSVESMSQARYWTKMPTFQNAINKIRFDRKNLRIYQQTSW